MKKAKCIIFSTIILFCFTMKGKGQDCGTDIMHSYLLSTDTNYQKLIHNLESQIEIRQQAEKSNNTQNAIYTIPVVVHVIHLGEPIGTGVNISDSIINLSISLLNERFRPIAGNGVDVGIEFCLASRDSNGNPTTGINRVNGSVLPKYQAHGISMMYSNCDAPSESSVKDLSRWPVSEYYNIWVVNQICQGFGGFAGVAHYPNGSPYDGTAIASFAMTNPLLAHEIGHGFFLFHTFNGDGGNVYCPVDTSCAVNGDRVCDTPPHKQADCFSANPCSSTGVWGNSQYNYMNYCPTRNLFSQGQKDRMRATAVVSPRASLLTSKGCNLSNPNPVNGETNNQLIIVPNPAIHSIIVKYESSINAEGAIQIFNTMGKLIYESNYFNREKEIDLNNFSAGIYYIRIGHGSKRNTGKLIVVKE